jgi:hypothetical protein
MRPTAKKIQNLLKNLNDKTRPELDKKILDDCLKELNTQKSSAPVKGPNIWSIIMHSKITKPVAAAMVFIAVILSLTLFDKTVSKTYAMNDVPDLFHSAKTLHIKGKLFFPEDEDAGFAETEHWLDIENSRWHHITPCYSIINGEVDFYLTEEIFDGRNTKVSINHREKKYTYFSVSDFQKNLSIQQTIVTLLQLTCGQPEMFDTYQTKGQEVINGETYNLWEGVIIETGQEIKIKLQSWLSPKTGQMAKAVIWRTVDGDKWRKQCEFETVEMNIPIEDSIFQLQGPADYVATNSIDTAMDMGSAKLVGGMQSVHLEQYFLFALPQNCLVMCWRNELLDNPEQESQYFNNLSFGGPVPQLPAEVYALKTKIDGQEYCWNGKHLMVTQKDGKYYEWALYTPENSTSIKPRHNKYAYTLVYRMNNDDKPNVTLANMPDMTIENQAYFEKLVLEAMKELSDDPALPMDITLEQILELAQDK